MEPDQAPPALDCPYVPPSQPPPPPPPMGAEPTHPEASFATAPESPPVSSRQDLPDEEPPATPLSEVEEGSIDAQMEIELLAPSTPGGDVIDIHAVELAEERNWVATAAAGAEPAPGPDESPDKPTAALDRWYERSIQAEVEEARLVAEQHRPSPNVPHAWFHPHAMLTPAPSDETALEPLRRPCPASASFLTIQPPVSGPEPAASMTMREGNGPVTKPPVSTAPNEPLEPAKQQDVVAMEIETSEIQVVQSFSVDVNRASTQERESHQAEAELHQYLERPHTPDGHPELPIVSGTRPADSENWDEESEVDTQHLVFRPPAPPESHRRKSSKGRASRYNPRRHLEADDVEHVVAPPHRRASPSPLDRRGQRNQQHDERRPRPRGRDGPYTSRNASGTQRRQEETVDPPRRSTGGLPVRTQGVRFGGLTPIPTDRRVDPEPHHCFNCWQRGHDALQCARPQAGQFCHNCGRRGVSMINCPRCRAAFQRRLAAPSQSTSHRQDVSPRPVSRTAGRENYRRSDGPLRGRLGPPVQPPSANDRQSHVRDALRMFDGLQRYSTEVGEAMLRLFYMHQ